MKINDLNHIETLTKSIAGGASRSSALRSAKARASAEALTIGRNTFGSTYTLAYAISGQYAASKSRSYASAQ